MGAGYIGDRACRAFVQHPDLIFDMRAITAAELLNVWEDGRPSTSTRRALLLLAAMYPGASRDTIASLSIGRRDAELLRLREALWGPRMAAIATCPACRERLELTLDTRDLLAKADETEASELSLTEGDCRVRFRIPTTEDLMAAEAEEDADSARLLILERCLLSAVGMGEQAGVVLDPMLLPAEVVSGIAALMAEADPLANIQLKIECPSCEHGWRAAFDIVSFLWSEIGAWAGRILSEVHTLARAYGWREAEILGLSATRRQFYLEMVGS
jgi:hypothetical protein